MANDFFGLLFPNVHDDLLSEMTEKRSMGSLPFAGRYRLVDFSLSNLVNAGISSVGIITKNSYQSLMDHIGNGKPWDLDRKRGGALFLPPYAYNSSQVYNGHLSGLYGVLDFIEKRNEKYVVLCDCDVVTNFDMSKLLDTHIESGADVTICYKHGKLPANHNDIMVFGHKNGKINEIRFPAESKECDYSLDIIVISKELLINLVKESNEIGIARMGEIFRKHLSDCDFRAYEITDYAAVIDSVQSYVTASRDLIDDIDVRKQLFNSEHPIFTKTRDDMPTKYGLSSTVEDSLIADGCRIYGTVKNSVIFRGVVVKAGAVGENCVLMQDSVVEENSEIAHVILDKNVTVTGGKDMRGTETYPIYVRKDTTV